MQATVELPTKQSAFESFTNLCNYAGTAAKEAGVLYTKSNQYAGKYWVFVKEHDAELTKVTLLAVAGPLLYYSYGSVGVGFGCAVFVPAVLPEVHHKIKEIWKDTDFGKLALLGTGFVCAKFDLWSIAAFSYGAYLGSKVRPPVMPSVKMPGHEQTLEQKLEQLLDKKIEQKLEKKLEIKPESTVMNRLWSSVFGGKEHTE